MASLWQIMVVVMAFLVVPWILTVIKYHLSLNGDEEDSISGGRPVKTEFQLNKFEVASRAITSNPYNITSAYIYPKATGPKPPIPPVLGPIPTRAALPLFGFKHTGSDAIFALASSPKYGLRFYERFVGSLRKAGFTGDIVMAVSPTDKMKGGVMEYLIKMNVIAYSFDVDCKGVDNCKMKDDFLGYPDPRPLRPFANIRYALYEQWLSFYPDNAYILILDFRDTIFQRNPFEPLGAIDSRPAIYDLRVYAENEKVKRIGNCVFNSMWITRCFGKTSLDNIKAMPVICSGSTMGSSLAMRTYIPTMLRSMDTVQCWKRGIESDQGYQNFLFYNGHFNTPEGNATLFLQGEDLVNTIGAMNGFRVPKQQTGSLDGFWKIRDEEGFILNNDGQRSFCIHQWDRWYKDLRKFVDTKLF